MDIVEAVRKDLGNAGEVAIRAVADELQINFYTLRKIAKGYTLNPRYNVVQKLQPKYGAHNQ